MQSNPMQSNQNSARLVFSIDTQQDNSSPMNTNAIRRWQAFLKQSLEIFGRYQVSATWAVEDPANNFATNLVLNDKLAHEIAVLGNPNWIGSEIPRTCFAKELASRFESARCLGIPLSTLALKDVELHQHFDLLSKYRISMIRGGSKKHLKTNEMPQLLRFGLWHTQPAFCLDTPTHWPLASGGFSTARRTIDRAIRFDETVLLLVDLPALLDAKQNGQRHLNNILQYADRQRKQYSIKILTLAELAKSLAPMRQSTSARSVLHPAA